MKNESVGQRAGSRRKVVVTFLLHELVATLGVLVAAPLLAATLTSALRLLGVTLYMSQLYWILTENPYFPVQAVLAFVLGWLLGQNRETRATLWVWVPPAFILALLVVSNRHVLDFSSGFSVQTPSRLSHFFGWGCQPKDHCFDQIVTTLPFYSAAAYSMGAAVRRYGRRGRRVGVAKATAA